MSDQPNEPAASQSIARAPQPPSTEEQILAARVGPTTPLNSVITLAEYDPAWPQVYAQKAAAIRVALGERALLLEHVGSTSVPGLAAKPLIDILLVVADSADEATYVPALEAQGYILRVREPDWFQHRVLKGADPETNLHVFSPGCIEIRRMLLMRDWLRTHPDDRALYERTKRDLAQRQWKYIQNYADAKSEVVEAILARASAADAPQPA
ncbi:MAG TPA: GrpB family protein [Ktedonobacterales bacterium]